MEGGKTKEEDLEAGERTLSVSIVPTCRVSVGCALNVCWFQKDLLEVSLRTESFLRYMGASLLCVALSKNSC